MPVEISIVCGMVEQSKMIETSIWVSFVLREREACLVDIESRTWGRHRANKHCSVRRKRVNLQYPRTNFFRCVFHPGLLPIFYLPFVLTSFQQVIGISSTSSAGPNPNQFTKILSLPKIISSIHYPSPPFLQSVLEARLFSSWRHVRFALHSIIMITPVIKQNLMQSSLSVRIVDGLPIVQKNITKMTRSTRSTVQGCERLMKMSMIWGVAEGFENLSYLVCQTRIYHALYEWGFSP